LRQSFLFPEQNERVHGHAIGAADLPREQRRLVKATPAQPLGMQRDRKDQIEMTALYKIPAAERQEPSQRFAEGDLASIFKSLHDLAQRVFF
jgi:hypothetical protein